MRDTYELGGVTWARSAELFAQADLHKPEGERFTEWKESQTRAHQQWDGLRPGKSSVTPLRVQLLLFPTGEGKSKTSLAQIASRGFDSVYVVAPPKTHGSWRKDAATLGLNIQVMSHKAFRESSKSNYTRNRPWIIDEFHLLGRRTGDGWKKLISWSDEMSALILCSATPEYNSPERVFCLTAIGDEKPLRNYEQWLYKHCETTPNRFAYYPIVTGFKDFDTSTDFLISLPWVAYVEDTATWTVGNLDLPAQDLSIFEQYGFSRRHHKIIASDMEQRHKRVELQFIDDDGLIRGDIVRAVRAELSKYPERSKWLIFCNHRTVAVALAKALGGEGVLIEGDTSEKHVDPLLHIFKTSERRRFLIGTTALATGVDGVDKVCQSLLILDDIEGDNAKRRQLIGRILPRGNEDKRERLVITAKFK